MHADAPPFDYMRPVGFIVHLSLEGHKSRDVRAMDQGGQRRDQVDATVVPNVRRQRGTAPASCARLQPRQFPAHAGDAGANQGLVADESEGKADQDRREGSNTNPQWF